MPQETDMTYEIEQAKKLLEKCKSYVTLDDDISDAGVLGTALRVTDRINEDIPSLSEIKWGECPSGRFVLWPDNAEMPYTKADLVALCKGNESVAFDLHACCESGVCPETVIDQDSHENTEDQCFGICHSN